MSILCDYHVHSTFSGDAKGSMKEMIDSAVSKGLKKICFTEHMDKQFPYRPGEEGMFELNADSYLYDLLRFKSEYEGIIDIGFGVEVGMQIGALKDNLIFSRSHEFDFILASIHVVDGFDPYYPEYFEGKTEEEAYGRYFETIYENIARFDNYDVLAHLDYIVRYGADKDKNYKYEIYKETIDKILKHIIEHEKGLELNTAGLRKGTRDLHPCFDIIKKYKELGGELVTIGSDAHEPAHVAADFDKAEEALIEAGFKYYCMYENRIAEYKKIG